MYSKKNNCYTDFFRESVLSNYDSDCSSVSSSRTRSVSPPKISSRSVDSCRPVSPMTAKQWNSMYNYIDTMVDVRLARNDDGNVCTCADGMKGHFHIAMIFEDIGSNIVPLSFGQNIVRGTKSLHAEHNAIIKLRPRYSKKLLPINVLVLKTSLTGLIGMSKPCSHCLVIMSTIPQKKGYKINNIFYTNGEGNIEKHKLQSLLYSDDIHVSKHFSDRGYKLNLKSIVV